MGMASTVDDLGLGIDGSDKFGDPYARVRKRVSVNERRVVQFSERHVAGRHAEVHIVQPGDTFRSIARARHIPEGLHKVWYNWLGVYFGEEAEETPEGCLGFEFPSPWEGEHNAKLALPVGERLPLPCGKSWVQWCNAFKRDEEVTLQERKAMRAVRLSLLRIVATQIDEGLYDGAIFGMSEGHGPDVPFTLEGVAERIQCNVRKVTAVAYTKYMSQDHRITKEVIQKMTDGCGNIIEPRGKNACEEIMKRPDREMWAKARKTERDVCWVL